MVSDVATCGADEPGKAWALNENIEATRPQAKIEAIFDMVIFPLAKPWSNRVLALMAVTAGLLD